ncbi:MULTISPECIES: hypothetical protein [unclassified Spirillospora]|uniref:hypothetical protein n=1 Tax=unclassified Spirillospora TaxID=2642701 RepID=UPI0037122373
MAYEVLFFCRCTQSHAEDFRGEFSSYLRQGIPSLMEASVASGPSWVAVDFLVDPPSDACRVTFRLYDDVVASELSRVSRESTDGAVGQSNALGELVLSGSPDSGLVNLIWSTFVEFFDGIPYDEESGFEAMLS